MTEELTGDQIALLCDIGEYDLSSLTGENRRDVEYLISEGYAEPTQDHPASPLQLTAKGTAFLSDRGAGLNEA